MNVTIEIECETYEELIGQIAEVVEKLKRRKRKIDAADIGEINFENANCAGSYEVSIIVVDPWERDMNFFRTGKY